MIRSSSFARGVATAVIAVAMTQIAVSSAEPAPSADSAAATRLLVTLLRSPAVQADLKADAEQQSAIDAAVTEIDLPLWKLRDVPAGKSDAAVRALGEKFQSSVRQALTVGQMQRIDQLVLRAKGLACLKDTAIGDSLNLSARQKQRITEILPNGPLPSDTLRVADLEKKLTEVLTEKQQALLREKLGKPFDFSQVRQIAVKAPELAGISGWVNSPPLKLADLHGKVVVLNFWTFGCINCMHNLPVYKTWYDELPRDRVVIVGVHTPETQVEHQFGELQRAVKQRDLKYAIAMDIRGETWNRWANSIWPSVYLIDRHGDVRYWWTGELKWQGAEGDKLMRQRIEQLLAEKD